MKLWMTRDKKDGHAKIIRFSAKEPALMFSKEYSWATVIFSMHKRGFHELTGLPLPRKGSKRQVEMSIVIKPAKGA